MSDEFYACGECGAQEQFAQIWATKFNGELVEIDEDAGRISADASEVCKCKACGAIDPETFMFASWEREKEDDI
jgi:hypothetical protein